MCQMEIRLWNRGRPKVHLKRQTPSDSPRKVPILGVSALVLKGFCFLINEAWTKETKWAKWIGLISPGLFTRSMWYIVRCSIDLSPPDGVPCSPYTVFSSTVLGVSQCIATITYMSSPTDIYIQQHVGSRASLIFTGISQVHSTCWFVFGFFFFFFFWFLDFSRKQPQCDILR